MSPPPMPATDVERTIDGRTVHWCESEIDGYRVDIVEVLAIAEAHRYDAGAARLIGFRAYVTDPAGRRVHKTAIYSVDEDATMAAWSLVGLERGKGKFRAQWWSRARAWFARTFRERVS